MAEIINTFEPLLGTVTHVLLMTATAIVRFWTLVMLAYYFLD